MSAKPELRALTSVRGIAAWWVVFFHLAPALGWAPPPFVDFLRKGYLAVDFFFLLSGFVIWLSYADRLRDGGAGAVGAFLKRRIARIWPLHAFLLCGAVALALVFEATGRADPVLFPWAELPLHFLLIQNWGFTGDLSWNFPAWSISAELGAYLAFPLLAWSLDWRRLPSIVVVAAIAGLLALLATIVAAAGADNLNAQTPRLGLIRCLFEFSAGTAVCALWLRWRDAPLIPALASAMLAVLMLAAEATGALPEPLAMPGAFAALLLALALTSGLRGNLLDSAPLHWLGTISYATYLSHALMWKVFKLALVSDVRDVPPWQIALFVAIVLAASDLLYRLVERPAQRWLNARRLRPVRRRDYAAGSTLNS